MGRVCLSAVPGMEAAELAPGDAAAAVASRSDCEVPDCGLIGMRSSTGLFAGGNSIDLVNISDVYALQYSPQGAQRDALLVLVDCERNGPVGRS